jgi:hypothetical protein
MTRLVANRRGAGKSERFPIGNQNCRTGNPISPVMQNVRGSLAGLKAAQELEILTGEPLSNCQKMLSGHRDENREMIVALCQTRLVIDTILGLIDPEVRDPTARLVRKEMKKLKLKLELQRLEAEEGA